MIRPSSRRAGGLAITGVLAGGLALALGACSLGLSLDGLTGGDAGEQASTDGSPAGDGSDATAPDGTTLDAGADTSAASDGPSEGQAVANEAGPDAHGGNDAGEPDAANKGDGGEGSEAGKPDAAVLGFCASLGPAPDFCDDFDEGASNPAWDQVTSLGGTVAVDGAESVSAPDSMVSTVAANQAEGSVDLAGYKSLTGKQGVAGTATLDFEVRIDAGDTSAAADAVLGAIQLYDGSAIYDLELEVMHASASTYSVSLTEDSPSVPHATGATIALSTWTHVTISVVLPAGNGGATTATLAIGGTSMLSTTVHVLSGGKVIATPIPEVLVGPTFATPAASGWAVRYDNVTFSVK